VVPSSYQPSKKLAMTMIDIPLDHRVLTALEQNPHIARRNLRFETEQGRVTLRGVVGTYYQKQMAQEAVRRVEGVQEIANELEVCWA
jgi:osmotically-inducible protein OsmY